MDSKNKKNMYYLLGGVFIVAMLLIVSQQTNLLTVVSSGVEEDIYGNRFLTTTYTVDNTEGQLYTLSAPTSKVENGSTETPKTSLTLEYSPFQQYCTYKMQRIPISILWGLIELDHYYTFTNAAPEKHLMYSVSVIKKDFTKTTKTFDAGAIATSDIVYDAYTDGYATITSDGYTQGFVECNTPSDTIVVIRNGVPVTISKNSLLYLNEIKDTPWMNQFTNPSLDENTNILKVNMPKLRYGVARFIVKTDMRYFDTVYTIPPEVVKPEIQSFDCISNVPSDTSQKSCALIFKNPSSTKINFKVTFSSDYASFNQAFFGVDVPGKSIGTANVVYTSTKINSGIPIHVKICASNSYGLQECSETEKTIYLTANPIIPTPLPPNTEICGNGFCATSKGETKASCPADCGNEIVPTPASCVSSLNYVWSEDDSSCVCKEGFEEVLDSSKPLFSNICFGELCINQDSGTSDISKKCVQTTDWFTIAMAFMGFVIVILLVVVLVGGKGKKKSR